MQEEQKSATIYKGDDLQAFHGEPIKITIENPEEYVISKAAVVINEGVIIKWFQNPTDIIEVNLDSIDTKKLSYKNCMKLVVFDEEDKQRTCDGELWFTAEKGVLKYCGS